MMLKIQHGMAALLLFGTGCATRPMTWRIQGRTLVPPGRPHPIILKGAKNCPSSEAIAARPSRSRTVLTVNADALGKQPPGSLAEWTAQAEETGCVASGQGPALADRILESGPQSLSTGYQLLHVNHARSGYVELGPENRLQVVTPIRRDGSEGGLEVTDASVTGTDRQLVVTGKTSTDLLGVEMAWYAVRADGIIPISAETRIQGVTTPRPGPSHNLFQGLGAGAYRLVYKSDQTTVIQAASSRAVLQRSSPDVCDAGGIRCIVPPRFVGVNPYLAVRVNGAEVRVSVGSTLRAVIRSAGKRPEEVMATLAIAKPFARRMTKVEFDHTKPDVLDLVLVGNETVTW